jgi:hypothetical protein
MTLLRALKDWRATYDPALSVRAKDPVQIGHEDPDYPGWVWCVDQSGLGGWLPKEILGKTGPTRDFDTRELSVQAGEIVTEQVRYAGWSWCVSGSGQQGWLPRSHLISPTAD